MKTIALLATFALASCADYGMTGNIFVVDPNSGAKGGLTVGDDGNTVTGTYVDEDGNVIGGGSVFFPKSKVKIIAEK